MNFICENYRIETTWRNGRLNMLLKTYQRCNFINKNAICLFWRICWIDASIKVNLWQRHGKSLVSFWLLVRRIWKTLNFNGGYDMKDAMLIANQSICNERQTMPVILLEKYGKYVFVDQLEWYEGHTMSVHLWEWYERRNVGTINKRLHDYFPSVIVWKTQFDCSLVQIVWKKHDAW